MLKINFHTHTARCGHAIGTDEEYVLNAIKGGVKVLGFSDHAPYKDPDPTERMDISEVNDYFTSIKNLKEKYKDQIEIHLGMEVECYPSQWETLKKWREETEYCILGQHYLEYNGYNSYEITDIEHLTTYVDMLEYACKHGLCDAIAHPDVSMWSYPVMDGSVRSLAARIADISIKYDMPLELNCGSGVRSGERQYKDGLRYAYPTRMFFEEFAKKNCRIIVGLDIHDPALFLTDMYIDRAMDVIKDLNCNIIEDYDLTKEAILRKKNFY